MPEAWMLERRDVIEQRLTADGFARVENAGPGLVFHRRKVQASRFGVVDSVVSLLVFDGTVSEADLVRHQASAVEAVDQVRSSIPRGLGATVEVHPISLAPDADAGAITALTSGTPNEWAMMIVPALVHDGGATLTMFTGNKFWGGAYQPGLRKRVQRWVGPV